MSFDIARILRQMDAFSWVIVGTLLLMGTATLAILIERTIALLQARRASRAYASLAVHNIEKDALDALAGPEEQHRRAPLARLLAAASRGFMDARRSGAPVSDAVGLAGKAADRSREALEAELSRGLSLLASVGSVSPFVGLLGTVVGIIAAFEGIAQEGSGGLGAVSGGIAEALVVTAFGLCVAIPSVLAFNYLSGKLDQLLLALDHGSGELLDHLARSAGATSGREPRDVA